MKFISTKIHGFLDYVIGLFLIASPFLYSYYGANTPTYCAFLGGFIIILYSVITDYEAGLLHSIPMKYHLIIDAFIGFVVAMAPWFFGFDKIISLPFVLAGVSELTMIMFTQHVTGYRKSHMLRDYEMR